MRHHVGRIHPSTLGIDSTVLSLVEVDEVDGVVFHVAQGGGLGERRHLEMHILLLSSLKTLKNMKVLKCMRVGTNGSNNGFFRRY